MKLGFSSPFTVKTVRTLTTDSNAKLDSIQADTNDIQAKLNQLIADEAAHYAALDAKLDLMDAKLDTIITNTTP